MQNVEPAADLTVGGPRATRVRRFVGVGTAVLALVFTAACVDDSGDGRDPQAKLLTDVPSTYDPPKVPPEPPAQPTDAGFDRKLGESNCPAKWSCKREGDPTADSDPEITKSGAAALRVDFQQPDGSYRANSEWLPVQGGRDYTVGVAVRSSIQGKAAESIKLLFYDEHNNLIGDSEKKSDQHSANKWYSIEASGFAPERAKFVQVSIEALGYDRTVWFDEVEIDNSPRIDVWGGTGLTQQTEAGKKGIRTLSLQLQADSADGVYVGSIDAFGKEFYVADADTLRSEDGERLSYSLQDGPKYDNGRHSIAVAKGAAGTISITGRELKPKPGSGFPKVVLNDPINEERYHVWVAVGSVTDTPTLRSMVRFVYQDDLKTTVRGLADYLDNRRDPDGGWTVAHETWPDDPEQDPMAIARIVQGYVYLSQASGSDSEARAEDKKRAIDGLDWLVANQHSDGGYGLPWPFGSSTGHLGGHEHYPGQDETVHPADHPYAITTAIVGIALLDGYQAFGDPKYLAAANKVAWYLLSGSNGFEWVDSERTRGSIPYCTLEPVMSLSDPRAQGHDVVTSLKNTAVEVYNIDGASLSFLTALYQTTKEEKLIRYGDALARNLAHRMHPDGAMPYAWYHDEYYSGGYARIVFNGLREWGRMRGSDGAHWVAASDRGYSWLANEAYDALLPTEGYSTAHGLGPSGDMGDYINRLLEDVRKDGSFSGGTNTRKDATNFAVLAELLVAIEH